jgi:hypothetical protein
VSTTSNAKRLKLIAATALGLDALTFFVSALVFLAVESFDWAIFVPFVVTGVLCFFAWEGLRSAGAAGGCLLPLAFVGLLFAFSALRSVGLPGRGSYSFSSYGR